MDIYVNMISEAVNDGVLGPYSRYCLWVSGCNRKCIGCISPESHDMYNGRKYSTDAIAWQIIPLPIEGITISGGEPFLQAQALCELIKAVKKHRDIGVIVYTGYLYEEIADLPYGSQLLELCDLIIDGPYIQELDDGKALRGSSNQNVIAVTERYKEFISWYGSDSRKVQIDKNNGIDIKKIGLPTNSIYEGET